MSKTPTVEDVNLKLREQAVRMGANAVINVTYARGVSATSWKALTANGTAVSAVPKLAAKSQSGNDPAGSDSGQSDPLVRIRHLAELLSAGAISQEEYDVAKQKLLQQL